MMTPLQTFFRMLRDLGLENTSNRYYSNYPGEVTGHTDKHQQGRVRVKIPNLGHSDPLPRFAYPSSPYAGPNYGFYFPPHEGDRVWAWFDHGDHKVPHFMGGWWPNQPKEKKTETSHIPAEFRVDETEKVGEETQPKPTFRRGIRSRGGSVLIFDDDPRTFHFEVYTGQAETEADPDGKERPKIGELSKKHHTLRLDDVQEEIVLATFGVGEEEDTPWEDRRHHSLTMRDKEDDRFIELRTAGADGTERHTLLLSDELKKILLESHDKHIIEIDDDAKKLLLQTQNGYTLEIDEKGKKITVKTKEDRSLLLNDDTKKNVLTEENSTFTQGPAGTKIETQGAFDVQATNTSLQKYSASLTVDVGATWTQRVAATAQMLITGSLQISAAQVTIDSQGPVTINAPSSTISPSGTVTLGTGAVQTLMNLAALNALNAHTHKYIAPLLPLPGPPLETLPMIASSPLVPIAHATISTKAG